MLTPISVAFLLVVAESAALKSDAKIEFRWLERGSIPGLTDDRGIRTTCGDELSYPHRAAVLTNKDLAWAAAKNHGSVMGLPGDHYTVTFRITESARKKLTVESGNDVVRSLAVFIDGKYWGTTPFRSARPAEFEPLAGFIKSKPLVDRIVKPFQ